MGKIGFVSYRVKLTDGKVTRRHVDHLRSRFVVDPDQRNDSHLDDWPVHPPMPGIRAGNHQGAPVEAPVRARQTNATSALVDLIEYQNLWTDLVLSKGGGV